MTEEEKQYQQSSVRQSKYIAFECGMMQVCFAEMIRRVQQKNQQDDEWRKEPRSEYQSYDTNVIKEYYGIPQLTVCASDQQIIVEGSMRHTGKYKSYRQKGDRK